MSDQTAPEPTMEEILASIRRIISEDEAPQGEDTQAAADDDEEEAAEAADESQAAPHTEATASPDYLQAQPAAPSASFAREEPLVSRQTATVAASAFGQLSAAVTQPREGARSVEDLARELLAPMLRQWLDTNLPGIVQAAVREEVERISRNRVG